MDVPASTIVVYSDLSCPWAHLAVHRLHEARTAAQLEDAVTFEHRPFPLELLDEQPTPKGVLDAEIPVVGALAPDAGWALWRGAPSTFPVSTLPALEAVQAAARQSSRAAEALDRDLRRALFADSRCITLQHEILSVARRCPEVDVERLEEDLWAGRARTAVVRWLDDARSEAVEGSPHLFLPDGTDVHNPGVAKRWVGDPSDGGFPVVDADDPTVYADLLHAAAA